MSLRFMLFQQENDPKHTSILVKKWFRMNVVQVLAQFPDLNPLENIWEEVERQEHSEAGEPRRRNWKFGEVYLNMLSINWFHPCPEYVKVLQIMVRPLTMDVVQNVLNIVELSSILLTV